MDFRKSGFVFLDNSRANTVPSSDLINRHYCPCQHLRALATDAACELNVLGHDGNTLGMDGAQVGILE